MVSCRSAQVTKNKKRTQVSTSPLRPEDTPFGPPTKLCVWAKFTDVINCAKFHLHWLSRFWAPGVQISQLSLCMGNRSYNSARTNVLHYDSQNKNSDSAKIRDLAAPAATRAAAAADCISSNTCPLRRHRSTYQRRTFTPLLQSSST